MLKTQGIVAKSLTHGDFFGRWDDYIVCKLKSFVIALIENIMK